MELPIFNTYMNFSCHHFQSMLFALPGYQFPYTVMNRCLYLRKHYCSSLLTNFFTAKEWKSFMIPLHSSIAGRKCYMATPWRYTCPTKFGWNCSFRHLRREAHAFCLKLVIILQSLENITSFRDTWAPQILSKETLLVASYISGAIPLPQKVSKIYKLKSV